MQNFLQNIGYDDARIPNNGEKRIYLLNIKNIDEILLKLIILKKGDLE